MKILSNNMSSPHKIYEYGNIAKEESFVINISGKSTYIHRKKSNEKISITLSICYIVRLFVCGISLTSGQLISELFPDCLKVKLFEKVVYTPSYNARY